MSELSCVACDLPGSDCRPWEKCCTLCAMTDGHCHSAEAHALVDTLDER